MKKIVMLLLCAFSIFILAGCFDKNDDPFKDEIDNMTTSMEGQAVINASRNAKMYSTRDFILLRGLYNNKAENYKDITGMASAAKSVDVQDIICFSGAKKLNNSYYTSLLIKSAHSYENRDYLASNALKLSSNIETINDLIGLLSPTDVTDVKRSIYAFTFGINLAKTVDDMINLANVVKTERVKAIILCFATKFIETADQRENLASMCSDDESGLAQLIRSGAVILE